MSTRPGWDRHDVRRRRRRKGRQRLAALLTVVAAAVAVAAVLVERSREPAPPPTATVPPPVPVTFPEGLRREDMARLLEEKTRLSGEEYLAATAPSEDGARVAGRDKPTSLEGFLFPATYEIGTETTVDYLVDQQVRAFQANLAKVNLSYARSRNLDVFDVVTIASMVEREVQVPSERPIVAGIIYNRLRSKMRLDIDATVQFAIGKWRPLTAKDLASDSPYNTRKFTGLPPGPIANPGLPSLRAAAKPRVTKYLYYVARDDGSGRHYFAESLADFERLRARAAENRASR
jgi:UPF0755 protein